MTYNELLKKNQSLPLELREDDVTIYDCDEDEYFGMDATLNSTGITHQE